MVANLHGEERLEKLDKPKSTHIEITNKCNLNCLMCNTKMSDRKGGYMTPKVFSKIISELSTVGIKGAGLHTVGETFMYKELDALVSIADKNKFDLFISTNAQFPDKIYDLYKKFPDVANTYRFSIDGAIEKTYEDIRVGGSFKKVLESLEVIHKINNGKINNNISFSIDVVVSLTNIKEVPLFFQKFSKYCFPENINFHLINGISPDASYFNDTFPYKNLIRSTVPCSLLFNSIFFTYDGRVTICARDYEAGLVVGDINDSSLISIWNNDAYEAIRYQHLNADELTADECLNCYEPFKELSNLFNDYAHYLHFSGAKLFGDKLENFLFEMDGAFRSKDNEFIIKKLKKFYL